MKGWAKVIMIIILDSLTHFVDPEQILEWRVLSKKFGGFKPATCWPWANVLTTAQADFISDFIFFQSVFKHITYLELLYFHLNFQIQGY